MIETIRGDHHIQNFISKIKLSIIIPIYNSEKYLPKCLNSVCSQYEKGIEVILIDDHSLDSSRKIIKKYKKKFNFIKIIYLQKNNGISYCRNIGIKYSKGEYLYFMDSDDELVRRSLNNVLYELYKFPEKELFVLNYFKKISKEKQILYNQAKDIRFKKIKSSNRKISLISCYNKKPFLTSWQFIFKKSFLKSNNLCYKNIYTSEDWEFIPKVLYLAKNFKIIKRPTYIWKVSRINSLGKKTGYLTAISCVQIISWLGQFIIDKEKTLKKREMNVLIKFLDLAYTKFWLNILCLNSRSISRLSKYLLKFRNVFKKLIFLKIIKLNYLLGREIIIKQKLTKYINKKNIIIKNLIKKFEKKGIIIFCAGSYTDIISQMFFNNGISIRFIIDNNVNYSGQKLNNISVFEPAYLKKNTVKHF